MLLRASIAALLALPSLAPAQTITVRENDDVGVGTSIINAAECASTSELLTFEWTVGASATGAQGSDFKLVASNKDGCPDGATNFSVKDVVTGDGTATGRFGTGVDKVTVPSVVSGTGVGCSSDVPIYFCVDMLDTNHVKIDRRATGSIRVDGVRPPAPELLSIQAGDSALTARWQAGSGSAADGGAVGSSASYAVLATPLAGGDSVGESTTGTSVRVAGLANGRAYRVTVTAKSSAGNESAASNAIEGTPVAVDDFWKSYQGAGGQERGGCSAGAAGALAIASLAAVLAAKRRRRS